MSTSSNREKGFGLVAVLLAVLLIAALAYAGIYVSKADKNAVETDTQTNTQAKAKERETLTISEWGIAFDQHSPDADLIYTIKPADADGIQKASFSYAGLAEIDKLCAPDVASAGTLTRYTPTTALTLPSGDRKTVAQIDAEPALAAIVFGNAGFRKIGGNYYNIDAVPPNSFSCGGKEAQDFIKTKVYSPDSVPLHEVVEKTLRAVT